MDPMMVIVASATVTSLGMGAAIAWYAYTQGKANGRLETENEYLRKSVEGYQAGAEASRAAGESMVAELSAVRDPGHRVGMLWGASGGGSPGKVADPPGANS